MLVIADTSPMIVLVRIGHASVLPALFQEIIVPSQVVAELRDPRRPSIVREFAAAPPPWMVVREPSAIESIPRLQLGERAAISLARELKASLLLIDEARGRHAAAERGFAVTGTIGILERAAQRGLLDLRKAFDAVKTTDFWVSREFLDERLKVFLASRKSR